MSKRREPLLVIESWGHFVFIVVAAEIVRMGICSMVGLR